VTVYATTLLRSEGRRGARCPVCHKAHWGCPSWSVRFACLHCGTRLTTAGFAFSASRISGVVEGVVNSDYLDAA
jgi:hypothetical protein